ncbi:hypothetical protein [Yinghuangia sp. YIM S09857]|uniref:hypothetical protein n=1 Tax=Yinghuangia sp. YIM S09857 TaxID=3436929 RepID=UPI003F53764E
MPRRAAVAAGVLALAGGLLAAAPAAQAQEVTFTSQCKNLLAPGLPIPPSETKVDIQISPVKDTYAVGDLVTVKWKWGSYSNVPESSPLEAIEADTTKPVGQINLTGSQPGVLTVEGERKNERTLRGQPLVITDMTATLSLTATGTLDFAPKQYSTFTQVGTFDAETECLPLTTPGVSTSITVEGGQVDPRTLDAPDTEVKPGDTITLSGTKFAPNTAAQLSLCEGDGSNCLANRFAANMLAIDGSGNLAGTATLATSGVPDGTYQIRVTDGVGEARANLVVKAFVPGGPRTVVADVSSGPLGTTVHLTGENWTGNRAINIYGLNADGFPLLPAVNLATTPDGKFRADYTVNDPTLTHIRIREGTSSVNRVIIPFTIVSGANATQEASVALTPGTLAMTQAGTAIDFGTATLNGQAQTLNGSLNQVTVTDSRGGALGWSLTGTMTDLVAANGTDKIPAGNIAWTPSCAAAQGSLDEVANGTAGPLGSTASMLCSVAPDGSTTGGRFTADAQLALTTPEFAAAGSYTGTLTLTLI